jgi:hypothetical protein
LFYCPVVSAGAGESSSFADLMQATTIVTRKNTSSVMIVNFLDFICLFVQFNI